MMKAAARLSAVLVSLLGLAAPALAEPEGSIATRAFTNHELVLYKAPGYVDPVGQLPGGLQVAVDRCSRSWCQVHGRFGHGWVYLYSLSFGQGPDSIYWPPEQRHGPYHPWAFWGEN